MKTRAWIWNIFHRYDIDTLERILKTGMCEGFSFPHSYFHTPDGIKEELSSQGFGNIDLISVEGIAHAFGDYTLPTDEKESTRLLKCIELTESIPELQGIPVI